MGRATVYCDQCGELVPDVDFEKGRALTVQGKSYCSHCKGAAPAAPTPPPIPPVGSPHGATVLLRGAGHGATSRIVSGIKPKSSPVAGKANSSSSQILAGVKKGPSSAGAHPQGSSVRVGPAGGAHAGRDGSGHSAHHKTPLGGHSRAHTGRIPQVSDDDLDSESNKGLYIGIGVAVLVVITIVVVMVMPKKGPAPGPGVVTSGGGADKDATVAARNDALHAVACLKGTIEDTLAGKTGYAGAILREQVDQTAALVKRAREKGAEVSDCEADVRKLEAKIAGVEKEGKGVAELEESLRTLEADLVLPPTPATLPALRARYEEAKTALGRLREPLKRLDKLEAWQSRLAQFGQVLSQKLPEAEAREIRDAWAKDRSSREDWALAISKLDEVRQKCAGNAAAVEAVDKFIAEVRQDREKEAEEYFEKTFQPEVRQLLNEREFTRAVDRAGAFPPGLQDTDVYRTKVKDLVAKARLEREAATRPPDSPPEEEDDSHGSDDSGGETVDLFKGGSTSGWNNADLSGKASWAAGEEAVIGTHKGEPLNVGGGNVNLDNMFSTGNNTWTKYEFSFECKLAKEGIVVLARIHGDEKNPSAALLLHPSAGAPTDTWITLKIAVDGSSARASVGASSGDMKGAAIPFNGLVAISLLSGAEIQVRNGKLVKK